MNMPVDKDGPSVHLTRLELVCGMCRFHKAQLVKSGRNPVWEHECEHPAIESPVLGDDDITPEDCPFRKASRARN